MTGHILGESLAQDKTSSLTFPDVRVTPIKSGTRSYILYAHIETYIIIVSIFDVVYWKLGGVKAAVNESFAKHCTKVKDLT